MRRILAMTASLVLLETMVSQTNHYLGPIHVFLFAGGLFVTFAALHLPARPGAIAVALGGLLNDAVSPVPFGTHMLLMVAAFLFIHRMRDRIPRDETSAAVVVALVANLGLFLGLSLIEIGSSPAPGSAWLRLASDLLWSQVAVALIGPWFFAFQSRVLQKSHVRTSVFD